MADVDTSFVQEILHIAKRQRETEVQRHSETDDLGTGFEVAKMRALGHPARLGDRPSRLKPVSYDRAPCRLKPS